MTDVPPFRTSIPGRLGATGRVEDDELIVTMEPRPETMNRGTMRASALSFAADAVAGVTVDEDPDQWSFTSELSLRVLPRGVNARAAGSGEVAREAGSGQLGPIEARTTILRRGRRSSTCSVRMVEVATGAPYAYSALTFAHVDRRPDDPVKVVLTGAGTHGFDGWGQGIEPLDRPMREAAGIEVVDAARGVVEVVLNPDLLNPAGALQGAMVALVIESGAEELVEHRTGGPVLVTELEIRYLAQSRVGPLRTRCEPMGDEPDAPVIVELVDQTTGQVTTHAYVRAVVVPDAG